VVKRETVAQIKSHNRRLHAGMRYPSVEAFFIERPIRRARKRRAKARRANQVTR
jgi:hypothetical protein